MLISCPTCCVSCLSLWQKLKIEFTWNDLLFWVQSVRLDFGPLLPWLVSCNGLSHGVGWLFLFSHTWHISCCCSLFWLMYLHSLVCACIVSSHSVGWLIHTPPYRIDTPLRLIKIKSLLGLILCWCTIGMRIHLGVPVTLCVNCIFAQCRMIAPNSSLQDWHAFALDKEPWFDSLSVYNWNEDSFKDASWWTES